MQSYVVTLTVAEGDIEAEFRVKLSQRRQRRRWQGGKKEYQDHLKTLEMLNDEAVQRVARFCQQFVQSQKAVAK
jgi:hypothetical protein